MRSTRRRRRRTHAENADEDDDTDAEQRAYAEHAAEEEEARTRSTLMRRRNGTHARMHEAQSAAHKPSHTAQHALLCAHAQLRIARTNDTKPVFRSDSHPHATSDQIQTH